MDHSDRRASHAEGNIAHRHQGVGPDLAPFFKNIRNQIHTFVTQTFGFDTEIGRAVSGQTQESQHVELLRICKFGAIGRIQASN